MNAQASNIEPLHPSPRKRLVKVNDINHAIRRYSGSTIALEIELTHIENSKRYKDRYLNLLSRQNRQLRLEITFY